MNHSYTNRLSREKSPYLLQHQHNPVDWFAWGPEAFEKARKENKPIFLSIGYSTCHWCHVMERESFENESIATYLNEHFVSIKVDREERPDVDKIYMNAVHAMGQGGGWPLNVFITPDLQPFYGGTYFPPEPRYGRPSFLQLLQKLHAIWVDRHTEVLASAEELRKQLHQATQSLSPTNESFSLETVRNAIRVAKREFDHHNGGFGGAPKFPRPCQPSLLLRWGARYKDPEAVEMVLKTCDAMARGGIYDQLGGGFARYSVDAEWLVPHFEKMLYDNAQLAQLYLDAHLVSGKKEYADTVRGILGYVLRDMTHPQGGFYSAEDADSEGKEGKFYCWTKAEIQALLSPDESSLATRYYGITEKGNFIDHSDPDHLKHQNILSLVDSKISEKERAILSQANEKLLAARSKRIRPHLDDKVLSSWNGLMLGAFARAYSILGDEAYLRAATRSVNFIKTNLWDAKDKILYHRWRDGERDSVQLLDAYAFLLSGVLDVYEATLEPSHLQFARDLADSMLARFYDPGMGGFWHSPAGSSDLILRVKEDYDGAEPSGNSVAVISLQRLGAMTDDKDYRKAALDTLKLFGQRLHSMPQVVPLMMHGLDFSLEEPRRIVITGKPGSAEVKLLLKVVHGTFQPAKVVMGTLGPVEPFAQGLPQPASGMAKAYVCTGTECLPPTGDPIELKRLLH